MDNNEYVFNIEEEIKLHFFANYSKGIFINLAFL